MATNLKEVQEYNEKQKDEDGDSKMNDDKKKKSDDENKVLPIIPLEKLISGYLTEQTIADWLSPATNEKGNVSKIVRLSSFPSYMAIQIQRYYINEAWVPQKHECIIPVPQQIDLEKLGCRGEGIQENEEELPSGGGGD